MKKILNWLSKIVISVFAPLLEQVNASRDEELLKISSVLENKAYKPEPVNDYDGINEVFHKTTGTTSNQMYCNSYYGSNKDYINLKKLRGEVVLATYDMFARNTEKKTLVAFDYDPEVEEKPTPIMKVRKEWVLIEERGITALVNLKYEYTLEEKEVETEGEEGKERVTEIIEVPRAHIIDIAARCSNARFIRFYKELFD